MGATGVASQEKQLKSIERNKEKYIETSHDIHANPVVTKSFMHLER